MSSPVDINTSPSLSTPPPNFTSTSSVVLPYPLERVFSTLATTESMEPLARLSSLLSSYTLGDTESIPIPSGSLSSARGTQHLPPSSSPDSLSRTKFTMEETVPFLGGLFKTKVAIEGSQTEDREGRCCLYESVAPKQNLTIWKLRSFEEVEVDGKMETKVDERIEGRCPGWLKWYVGRTCRNSHKAHMEAYHTLFN